MADPAAPAPGINLRPLLPSPATAEEVEKFIQANARWLDEAASAELKAMSPEDQKRVIAGGTIVSCRDATGVMRSRVRQAKEKEQLLANARAGLNQTANAQDQAVVIVQGGGGKLAKPATAEEVEAFIGGNRRWLSEEAEELLRAMSPVDQKRVLAAGTLSGCRDPVAVVQTRAKRAREMEQEFENLTKGGGTISQPKVDVPAVPMPTFSAETGMAYIFAAPQEVSKKESRFGTVAGTSKLPYVVDTGPSVNEGGESKGVGGVVEIVKAKYGCAKGQKLKVIGETDKLLQFEGGKTAPKNHEGTGWKWVMREDASKAAAEKQASEEARRLEMEQALKAREARLKAEAEEKDKEKDQKQKKSEQKMQIKISRDQEAAKEQELEKQAAKEKEEAEKKAKEEAEKKEREREEAAQKAKEAAKEKLKEAKKKDSSDDEKEEKSKKSKKEDEKDKKSEKEEKASEKKAKKEDEAKKDSKDKGSGKKDSKKEEEKKKDEKGKDKKKRKRGSSSSDSGSGSASSSDKRRKAKDAKKSRDKRRRSPSTSRSRSRDKKRRR